MCSLACQITFVFDHDPLDFTWQTRRNGLVSRSDSTARIDQLKNDICTRNLLPSPVHAHPFNDIIGVSQSGGIDDVHRDSRNLNGFPHRIACRPGKLGDDCALLTCQTIEQGRLSYIRQTRQHHLQTRTQHASRPGPGSKFIQRFAQNPQLLRSVGFLQEIDFFIGKIQAGFDKNTQSGHALHEAMNFARKLPRQGT